MDTFTDISLTGEFLKPPTPLDKPTHEFELSDVQQQGLQVLAGGARISAFLAERQAFYASEKTTGRKQKNQDTILISQPAGAWHVGVADGVGGLPLGEVASTQALRFIHHYFQRYHLPELFKQASLMDVYNTMESLLNRAARHLNRLHAHRARQRGGALGRCGATTVVGAFALNTHQVVVYSVGDSGIALVPKSPERPILYSRLHTTFEQVIIEDDHSRPLSRRQALHADFFTTSQSGECRDLLTAAIGGGEKKPRDFFLGVLDIEPGDTLFLFSDGLYKTVGKRSEETPSQRGDLRLSEYGRPNALLEYLAQPRHELNVLADAEFRARQFGPTELVDDTAIVRVELGFTPASNLAGPTETSRPRSERIREDLF